MAAGPWLPALLGSAYSPLLRVFRQVLHWFPTNNDAYAPEHCPVYLWMHGTSEEDYFYGFPKLTGSAGIKVASERYGMTTTADAVDRQVAPFESAAMFERHIRGRLRDVEAQAAKASACLYTVTPDSGFLIDALPEIPGVVIASACSGHGFKHSAALGECIAQEISGITAGHASFSTFGLSRFRREAA
jgi:sarcosine oxidase